MTFTIGLQRPGINGQRVNGRVRWRTCEYYWECSGGKNKQMKNPEPSLPGFRDEQKTLIIISSTSLKSSCRNVCRNEAWTQCRTSFSLLLSRISKPKQILCSVLRHIFVPHPSGETLSELWLSVSGLWYAELCAGIYTFFPERSLERQVERGSDLRRQPVLHQCWDAILLLLDLQNVFTYK